MCRYLPGFPAQSRSRVLLFSLLTYLLIVLCYGCQQTTETVTTTPKFELRPQLVVVNSPRDIVLLSETDSLVAPLLYSNITGLDSLPLYEKKMRFISALLPAILVAKEKLAGQKEDFKTLIAKKAWNQEDSLFFQQLAKTFKTQDTLAILSGLQTHPNSIVLGQAAIESGWGNSRIFAEGNNLFGIWSYSTNEPRIAASVKRDGKTIYLRKYADISASIIDYFITIGRSRPYREFRKARLSTENVNELIPHLLHYSERREAYVDQLASMIRFNNLKRFDHYQLDSSYYVVLTPTE